MTEREIFTCWEYPTPHQTGIYYFFEINFLINRLKKKKPKLSPIINAHKPKIIPIGIKTLSHTKIRLAGNGH